MPVGNDRAWCGLQWGLFGSLFQVSLLFLVIMSKAILALFYKSYFSFFGMIMVMRTEEKDGLFFADDFLVTERYTYRGSVL